MVIIINRNLKLIRIRISWMPINIVICRSFMVLQKLESCVRDTQERTFVIKFVFKSVE